MADLSGLTLMMAIQAVNLQMNALEAQIAQRQDSDEDDSHLEDALLAYSKAANELRTAYESTRAHVHNLPPYERLVSVGGGA